MMELMVTLLVTQLRVNFSMKVIARVALCLTLITGAASAAEVEKLPKETTVNYLVEEGFDIISVSGSDYITTYTLMNFAGDVVTCRVGSNDKVSCFKP
tara:strand:- start:64 stop:357 length:294 start_codon:yes stop_codon:yes gene_type:complete